MFDFFKHKEILPGPVKKSLAPSADFLVRNRTIFLSAFGGKFAALSAPKHFTFAAKAFAAVFAAFIATGGAAVYADKANVGAKNALYPLKRASESVQSVLAQSADKPALQLKFAKRRAQEIEEIKKEDPNPSSTATIREDLQNTIDTSLAATENKDVTQPKLQKFCGEFDEFISGTSSDVEDILNVHPQLISQFQGKCGTILTNSPQSEEQGAQNGVNIKASNGGSGDESAGNNGGGLIFQQFQSKPDDGGGRTGGDQNNNDAKPGININD